MNYRYDPALKEPYTPNGKYTALVNGNNVSSFPLPETMLELAVQAIIKLQEMLERLGIGLLLDSENGICGFAIDKFRFYWDTWPVEDMWVTCYGHLVGRIYFENTV